jgi:WD40 repeat protein
MLASTGYDKVAVIWDLETGQLVQRLLGPNSEMLNIAFSPDGRWLAAGTNDGTLILWDAATGEARLLPGHSGWISSLAFSPDGQTLASSSFDTTVSLSNLATGQVRTIQGYTHFIDEVAVAAGGRLLVTSSGVPVLWDVTSGQASRLSGFAGSQWTADITPDGTRLATGGSDRNVNLRDGVTGQFLYALQGHGDMVRKLAFSAEGDLLASGSDDGTVIVWDVASGQPRQTWTGDGRPLFSLALSADDRWLAAGIGPDVTVWDVDSGQVQATLEGYVSTAGRGYSSAASDLAFSPDGKLLATAGLDREHSVQLWDVASGQLLDRLQGQTSGALGVALSPDGRVLATSNPFHQVVLWDVATGQVLATLDGHTDLVVDVAFCPDGTVLASGSYDGTVRVWGLKGARIEPKSTPGDATAPPTVTLVTPTVLPVTPTPFPPPTSTPTVRPEDMPRPVPTPTDAPVSPHILTFEVTPARVDPGETVTLTWETSGDWITLCPSARFALFSSDDCQQVSPSGVTTFTIPLEAAGFQFISFSLSVQARDVSDAQVSQASVALKCHTIWFFSDEPQAGICPTEPVASYAAAQRFERGTMIWLEQIGRYIILDERLVYEHDVRKQVHFVHDPLEIIRDTSAEINPPPGFYAPESGFGPVWRGDVGDSSGYREILGWALAPEFGYEAVFQCDDALPSGGRSWQTCYLKGPDDEIIVFHPLGGWYLLDGGLRCVTVSEVSIEVCFPANYSLAKNAEANRRGTFVSYDFRPLGGYQTPYLKEMQFFSEASIAEFTSDCDDSTPCFFGDYPDLDRYRGQREALRMLTGYQDFELQSFNGRPFLVGDRPCYADDCVIREYTAFLGDVKLDIWIVMADESEIEGSDQLLTQLIIQASP